MTASVVNWKLRHPAARIQRVIVPASGIGAIVVYVERGIVGHARVNGRAA